MAIRNILVREQDDQYSNYRIPGIVVTKRGTVITDNAHGIVDGRVCIGSVCDGDRIAEGLSAIL